MKRKFAVILILTILFSIGVIQFIRLNNDHVECEQTVERMKNENGEMVTVKNHVCKERFNF